MRITRSTLRRLIAEESARLLREAAEEEGQMDEGAGDDGIPKMLHVMYRGFRPVFIVTDVDANPLGEEAEDVTEQIAPAGSNMSTPEYAKAIIDFITDESNGIMYVFDEEMNDSETDDKFETEDYVEHLESLIASGEEEAATRGAEMYMRAGMSGEDEDLYEAKSEEEEEETEFDPELGYIDDPRHARHGKSPKRDKGEHDPYADEPNPYGKKIYEADKGHRTDEGDGKRHVSPRHRLAAYLEKQGADVAAVLRAIDGAVSRAEERGEEPSSEDVTFNLDDSVLDAIPEEHADKWHSMIDAVLADEFDADAVADAAAYRRDIEDTERDLSHPSRFLEEGEGDDDSQGEEEDTSYFDQTDWSAAEVRAGRHAEGPYGGLDSDTPEYHERLRKRPDDLGQRRMAALAARGIRFRHGGEDVDMEPYDSGDEGDNLSESRWAKIAGILKG